MPQLINDCHLHCFTEAYTSPRTANFQKHQAFHILQQCLALNCTEEQQWQEISQIDINSDSSEPPNYFCSFAQIHTDGISKCHSTDFVISSSWIEDVNYFWLAGGEIQPHAASFTVTGSVNSEFSGSNDEIKWFLVWQTLLSKSLKAEDTLEQQKKKTGQTKLLAQLLGASSSPCFCSGSVQNMLPEKTLPGFRASMLLLFLGWVSVLVLWKPDFVWPQCRDFCFPLWTFLPSCNCCLLLSHLLSNGLLFKHSQPRLA